MTQPDTARERLRRVLEVLTVLGEIRGTQREVAHSLVAELKALGQIQDDRPLDALIAGMHANRQVIGDTYREQRPVGAEQLLWAAADVAQWDSPARIARVLMTTLGRQPIAADPPSRWRSGRPCCGAEKPRPQQPAPPCSSTSNRRRASNGHRIGTALDR